MSHHYGGIDGTCEGARRVSDIEAAEDSRRIQRDGLTVPRDVFLAQVHHMVSSGVLTEETAAKIIEEASRPLMPDSSDRVIEMSKGKRVSGWYVDRSQVPDDPVSQAMPTWLEFLERNPDATLPNGVGGAIVAFLGDRFGADARLAGRWMAAALQLAPPLSVAIAFDPMQPEAFIAAVKANEPIDA